MDNLVDQIDSIAQDWLRFIKESHEFRIASDNRIRVNTPFTDPFGDEISLMISLTDKQYTVSDQGYTLWNLKVNGLDLSDKRSQRYRNLMSILDKTNTSLSKSDVIQTTGSKSDIPQMINDLTQTLIQVSDLIYLSRNNTKSVFLEDVRSYFETQKDTYSTLRGMSMRGQSQLKYNIDYIFNLTVTDRKFVNVYNALSRSLVEQLIGIWADTIQYRKANDQEKVPLSIIVPNVSDKEERFVSSLSKHNIDVVPFDDKEQVNDKLAIR
ncbi:hypothetical protein FD04_GL000415 [Secundilactobacillus odoratitofui DSM 19909 = JCM 15043]|uniref:DUF1828 domain-containing protein n=1 Tax=Secundilactobacillus odoratitofui DSM 19909 = JCM 15043 TaxID=1423776 RepID=A0A0R1LTC1_9LACO|nr:DUF1828 domain-containing protein [Secundilactobacillus odoratitofui]KRK98680.1 hypothetical protein FD04_GL000415 [Secundilactobacillus odoratitofui DSM 19909 = JCM 15043]